jgi:hypothetical protein
MASSGTVTFRTNRDAIIESALRLCNGIDPENSAAITSTQTTNAAQALNLLVKGWQAEGIQVWERKYGVIFPQKSQGIFVLGSPGPAGDHACLSNPMGSGFVQTTLTSDAASGASTIVVDSTSGLSTVGITATSITNAYTIGVELDSGTVQWTTVNGAPSGTTVTLTATLTGAASDGNNVFCYQTKLTRPLRILDAFVQRLDGDATGYPTSGGSKSPIRLISKQQYNRFGSVTSGTPTQLVYDPQVNTGYVSVFPKFDAADKLLYIEFSKAIEDFSASSDDHDMPQEWGEAIKYNLAWRIAPEYSVPKAKYDQIKELAILTFSRVNSWDQDASQSLFLGRDYD